MSNTPHDTDPGLDALQYLQHESALNPGSASKPKFPSMSQLLKNPEYKDLLIGTLDTITKCAVDFHPTKDENWDKFHHALFHPDVGPARGFAKPDSVKDFKRKIVEGLWPKILEQATAKHKEKIPREKYDEVGLTQFRHYKETKKSEEATADKNKKKKDKQNAAMLEAKIINGAIPAGAYGSPPVAAMPKGSLRLQYPRQDEDSSKATDDDDDFCVYEGTNQLNSKPEAAASWPVTLINVPSAPPHAPTGGPLASAAMPAYGGGPAAATPAYGGPAASNASLLSNPLYGAQPFADLENLGNYAQAFFNAKFPEGSASSHVPTDEDKKETKLKRIREVEKHEAGMPHPDPDRLQMYRDQRVAIEDDLLELPQPPQKRSS